MSFSLPCSPSYLDSALEFPNNTSSARVSSHSPSASPAQLAHCPSLYVTFKVLQLVNQFRKRVQTRVRSTAGRSKDRSSRLTEDFCQAFEREAAEHIDHVLGKSRVRPARKTPYSDFTRGSLQERKASKRSVKLPTVVESETDSTAAKKIEWLLKALDKSVKSEPHSLSSVAKNHKLFVERKEDLKVDHDSWQDLLPQLLRVTNLLDTLRRAPSSKAVVKTFAESDEGVDVSFDESIVANLEHLLLCLKEQLVRLLIAELRELVRTHVIECQRDQRQHTKEIVLEFPDGRHPLSTTWPWSIRPSLAVLWGVCWMFYTYYDHQGNMRDSHNNNSVIYSAEDLQQTGAWDVDQSQDRQQQEIFQQFQGQQNQSQAQQRQRQRQHQHQHQQQQQRFQGNTFAAPAFSPHGSPGERGAPRRMMPPSHSPVMTMAMTQPQSHPAFLSGHTHTAASMSMSSHPPFATAPDQAAHAVGPATAFRTNNAFDAAPPASYAGAPPASVHYSLPEEFHPNFNYQPLPGTYVADPSGPWMPPNTVHGQQPSNYFTLPPHSGIPEPGTLRLQIPAENQPQDFIHSATPVSAISATSSHHGSNYGHYLSPQDARARASLPMNPAHPPEQPYTTPKSESPVPRGIIAQQLSRKRSHDAMPENGQGHHSRNGSRDGSEGYPPHQPSGDDESPGRQRLNTTISRPDPPQNKDGKYICTYSSECDGCVFDRKCEWNKHMDKHDRPYRCTHPDCAKLQGFTYSGGLLRHEREVHNKHGGPKAKLMCHFSDCKRKNKGFTRKENLNEHIRRVHSKESQSHASLKRDATEAGAIAGALQEDAETPASRYSESGIEHDESLVSPTHQPKRRRLNSNVGDSTEIEILRHDNAELRDQVTNLSTQIQQLREMMQGQHPTQQGAPVQG